jgi:hypothetical protein
MKAARERPGPPACTAWSAKSPSSVRAGAPRRSKDSTNTGTVTHPSTQHEGQGRGHLPIRAPLGGVPGGGRKPGGTRSAHSKGGSCRVDDGNVTHHKPVREHEHDIPPGPGSEGKGDTKRVRGAGGGRKINIFTVFVV